MIIHTVIRTKKNPNSYILSQKQNLEKQPKPNDDDLENIDIINIFQKTKYYNEMKNNKQEACKNKEKIFYTFCF